MPSPPPPLPTRSSSPPHNNVFTPLTTPILLLPTPTAHLYSTLHPLLLLTLFALSFPSLVADPVRTLRYALPPLSAVQVAYVVTCLPAWGGGAAAAEGIGGGGGGGGGGAGEREKKGGEDKKRRRNARGKEKEARIGGGGIVPSLLSLLLSFLVAAPSLTIILILFGAPLTTHLPHTLLCATHMALLAALPLFYVYGLDRGAWREITSASLPFDKVWGGGVGVMLGAWAGAVPIPLDWDREWQKWPITIVTGAYLGYVVGTFAGEYLLRGKRIKFD